MNISHIPVNTNLETPLKSDTQENAIKEVKALCVNPFEGYEWKIENCDEDGINELNEALKNQITQIIAKDLAACIEENN